MLKGGCGRKKGVNVERKGGKGGRGEGGKGVVRRTKRRA